MPASMACRGEAKAHGLAFQQHPSTIGLLGAENHPRQLSAAGTNQAGQTDNLTLSQTQS